MLLSERENQQNLVCSCDFSFLPTDTTSGARLIYYVEVNFILFETNICGVIYALVWVK
jgi:hypothetical protein